MTERGGIFQRKFFASGRPWTWIGEGSVGGKAAGLIAAWEMLHATAGRDDPGIPVSIPAFTVLRTDVFDRFLERNGLREIALSDAPDREIAQAFQRADLPAEILGDLRALVDEVRTPLAVRSSSLLEDSLHEPFAGVYATKMLPNHQPDPDARFRRLMEAVKLVYATVFFQSARQYIRKVGKNPADEKMAVMMQEVVGKRTSDRFYPDVSGVARSYNYYAMGDAAPGDGVVSLALGLGKTIVDGGACWVYSPARPTAPPPVGSAGELLDRTQSEFWAVGMGGDPPYDPVNEAEYLVRGELADAESDGRLDLLASTYDFQSERLRPGTASEGPRVLNFAGLLDGDGIPLNAAIRGLLASSERAAGAPVEIEFAAMLSPPRFEYLQMRPMVVSDEKVDITDGAADGADVLAASTNALGNGTAAGILDVVYIPPERFDYGMTQAIAAEIDIMNAALLAEGRPYLLIGFGRWGSADPWLGIPVTWDQVSGAKVIVEAAHPQRAVDLSQGSHFFHNLMSFRVLYFSMTSADRVDWEWLTVRTPASDSGRVRHLRLDTPLEVMVDGRTKRGIIRR